MKYYELAYLVSPDYSEEEIKALQEKINGFIQAKQGILEKDQKAVLKSLSYPIQKKSSAYLVSLEFHLSPEKVKELEGELKLENKILRFLLLTRTFQKTKILDKPIKKVLETKIVKSKEKVKLKEIEEKLDEILK